MSRIIADQKSIINIVNEHGNYTDNGNGEVIYKLNIRTFNTGGDFGSTYVMNVRHCSEVRQVCGVTEELSMNVLSISVASVGIRQQHRATLRFTNNLNTIV